MTTLKIRESAIANNVQAVRRHTDKRLIAVVKEDGYGLGLDNACAALMRCGVDCFAVATPWEAMCVSRMEGVREVLLLTPEFSPEALEELVRRGVALMLGGGDQAAALRQAARRVGKPARVHLKVDTGLGRYGYPWTEMERAARDLDGLQMEGCYTHFAAQAHRAERVMLRQFDRFEQALGQLREMGVEPGLTHACASRAFAALGDLGCGAVRLGSLLLGRCAGRLQAEFQDAVYLEAPVFQTRLHRRGEVVGYDARCRLKRDTLVGLVRVGYADGAFLGCGDVRGPLVLQLARCVRAAMRGDRGARRVRAEGGAAVPVLGRVGMNHVLVDLTDLNGAQEGTLRIDVSPLLVRREIPRVMTQ